MWQDSLSKLKATRAVVWHSDMPRVLKPEGQSSIYFPRSIVNVLLSPMPPRNTATLSEWHCACRKGHWSTVDWFSMN